MVPIDDLREQNGRISELVQVLEVMIQDERVCHTTICRELFERFTDTVREHLDTEDRTVYSDLLNHADRQVNGAAQRYLSGTREIKRLMGGYMKRWCSDGPSATDRARFLAETGEMFQLLRERIRAEDEELFPLVATLQQGGGVEMRTH